MPYSKYIRDNLNYSYGTADEVNSEEDISALDGVSKHRTRVHDEALELDIDGIEEKVGVSKNEFAVHKESSEATKQDYSVNQGKRSDNVPDFFRKFAEKFEDYFDDEDEDE